MRYSIPQTDKDIVFFKSPTSRALAMLRWPLALCIIAVHWFQWGSVVPTVGMDPETAHLPLWAAITGFVKAFLSENGVASFFFISGFLFFAGAEFTLERYKAKLQRRLHTLLIPYILWNILTVAFLAAHYLPMFANVFPRMQALGFDMTWGKFFKGLLFTTPPHNPNLWFIRELMTFVILTPLLYGLLKRFPRILFVGMFLSAVLLLRLDSLYWQQFTWAILFFSIGAFLAIRNCDLVRLANDNVKVALVLFPLFGTLCWLTMTSYPYLSAVFKLLSLLPVIILAIWVAGWFVNVKGKRANAFLTGATFFVFVFHPLIISHLIMFLARVFKPSTDLAITSVYLAGYFLLVGITLAIYWVLARCAPFLTGLLTGRRNAMVKAKNKREGVKV